MLIHSLKPLEKQLFLQRAVMACFCEAPQCDKQPQSGKMAYGVAKVLRSRGARLPACVILLIDLQPQPSWKHHVFNRNPLKCKARPARVTSTRMPPLPIDHLPLERWRGQWAPSCCFATEFPTEAVFASGWHQMLLNNFPDRWKCRLSLQLHPIQRGLCTGVWTLRSSKRRPNPPETHTHTYSLPHAEK